MEVGVDVVILLLAEAIPRRWSEWGFRAWRWPERGVGARRRLGTMVPLVVDGVFRGADVLLGGRLAVALGRLHADESEVEGTDLLRVLKGGGLERDDLLRQRGDFGRHRSERRQMIDFHGEVVELGTQIAEGGGDCLELLQIATYGHTTRLD